MLVDMKGKVVSVGASEYEGKKYPYFEILQTTEGRAEVVRIGGNGVTVGQDISITVRVYQDDRKNIKVRQVDTPAVSKK